MAQLIIYDSSRAKSLASAFTALMKYPSATLKDFKDQTLSDINTYIGTLSAAAYEKIYCLVDNQRVEEVVATATITLTAGAANEVGYIQVANAGGTVLLSVGYTTDASTDEADALIVKGIINNGTSAHGFSADNSAGVLTISAPAGSGATGNSYVATADADTGGTLGIAITNDFTDNDTGVTAVGVEGDISQAYFIDLEAKVEDDPVRDNTAQAGANTTITLDASASATDDYYNGMTVIINGGTGDEQAREIVDYVGSTKVATVDTAWGTNPDATSGFLISQDLYAFGRTYNSIEYPQRVWSHLYSGVQVPILLTTISKAAVFEKDDKTATGVAAGTLTDTGEFTSGKYDDDDYYVGIKSATTGGGQVRKIASNTANVLTLSENWDETPTGTVVYQIDRLKHLLYDQYVPLMISTFFWDIDNKNVQKEWWDMIDQYRDADSKNYTYQDQSKIESYIEQAADIASALHKGVTL